MKEKNKTILFIMLLLCSKAAHTQAGSKFVLVKKGTYAVGKKNFPVNPLRNINVDSFYIAVYETTNSQFNAFIKATGYVTDAERKHDALVYRPGLKEFEWATDSTACWRFPNGVSYGGIAGKMNHPVACISYHDIMAYCKWAGVRLPTLDEWEIACRAGSTTDYFFSDENTKIGQYGNIWQGRDHLKPDSTDGYLFTAPVGRFKPNAWGLYDMYGNVFEFCSGKLAQNESKTLAHARGGSWWCSKNACNFFNSYDVGRVNMYASFSNQGFRVVKLM